MPPTTPTPAQSRLATGLTRLKALQDAGQTVFRSRDFDRRVREALLDAGFLRMVVKGWYMAARPGEAPGDTTPWIAAVRDFIAGYCDERFGEAWHLAPEYSLLVHAGATALPRQAIVHSPRGTNSPVALPDGHSLLLYKAPDFPTAERIERVHGLRVLTIPAALVRASPTFFARHPLDAQVILGTLRDAADLNRELLDSGRSHAGGRLAGALRALGRSALADDVLQTLRAVGHEVTEVNPFTEPPLLLASTRAPSPYVLRLRYMWAAMRDEVNRRFPAPPASLPDADAYLADVADVYTADAYHSLSIEGYRVSEALIERVASGAWNPEAHAEDRNARDALAARGYLQAHEAVKRSISRVLMLENAGEVARADHGTWYRELFGPSIIARLVEAKDLAGYRSGPVFIKNAAHIPPPAGAAREMMPVLFDLLAEEPSAAVRAVLGHFCFVFIHPYMDGNGRMGRFLMNTMLASGGYPWTIIRVERRAEYMAALDAASAGGDIGPFADFLASCLARWPVPCARRGPVRRLQ